jgi:hypothetical protein
LLPWPADECPDAALEARNTLTVTWACVL